jgi:hypothetical protein
MPQRLMGSGGVSCTPRMSALIAQAGSGVLPTSEGGQELRGLYQKGQSYFTSGVFVLIDSREQPLLSFILACSTSLHCFAS